MPNDAERAFIHQTLLEEPGKEILLPETNASYYKL
jgi:hypothetical protein